ncbi:hypothetical protein, partial [Neisseria sp. P0017.S004]|uniref:hypothetical protein n=1 Tax=Neisseria sp. P0017.S004 TaxID=3436780 RepID=UPI003F7D3C4F
DYKGIVRYTNSNPVLVTVPSGLGPAWSCTIVQEGTGQVTLAPAGGVALEGRSGLNTAGQWATIGIAALENNLLVVGGDTTP